MDRVIASLNEELPLDDLERAEICWLRDQGVLFPATIPADEQQIEELRRVEGLFVDEPNYFTRFAAEQLRSQFSIDAVALESDKPIGQRNYSFRRLRFDGIYAVDARCLVRTMPHFPHIQRLDGNQEAKPDGGHGDEREKLPPPQYLLGRAPARHILDGTSSRNGSVVDIVLKRFPYVDDGTPWERVLEFRNDANAKARRNALRKWMSALTREPFKEVEIEREIDCLLSAYEEYMRVHKMAVCHGLLRTVVVGAATVLEDLVKIKWGKIAESLFSLSERRTTLMKEELNAPGRELSYLLAVSKEFSAAR